LDNSKDAFYTAQAFVRHKYGIGAPWTTVVAGVPGVLRCWHYDRGTYGLQHAYLTADSGY
jgi:hypothetical protein